MTRKTRQTQNDSELRAALHSLLLDIEEMYEGMEISPDSGDEEEYFGPFSVGKLNGVEIGDIRINDQWRICFEWPGGAAGPSNVEITDYH